MLQSLKKHLVPMKPATEKKVEGHTDNNKPSGSSNCEQIYQLAEFAKALGISRSGIYSALYRTRVGTPHVYNNVDGYANVTSKVPVPIQVPPKAVALLPAPRLTPLTPSQDVSEHATVKTPKVSPYLTPPWINSTPPAVPAVPTTPLALPPFITFERDDREEPLVLLYGACLTFLRRFDRIPNHLHVAKSCLPRLQRDICLEIQATWDEQFRFYYRGQLHLIKISTGADLPAMLKWSFGEDWQAGQAIAVYYA